MSDPRAEYPEDTYGYQMWSIEQMAKRLGAVHILAEADQLEAKRRDLRDQALQEHFDN